MRPRSCLAVLTWLALAGSISACSSSHGDAASRQRLTGPDLHPTVHVTVSAQAFGRPIPRGFVGLSTELPSLYTYAGPGPGALNPLFRQLVRNLAAGQRPLIRVAGDSTDATWWPVPGMQKPLGIRYTLRPHWLATARAVSQALNARLILGINLEEDNLALASAEARAMLRGIGRRWIEDFEVGNEPELYSGLTWFVLNGRSYHGRPPAYDYSAFIGDFSRFARSLAAVPLAGPNIGAPPWFKYLGPFLGSEPRVGLATLHRYPLKKCSDSTRLRIPQLLSDRSSRGLAQTVAGAVRAAHRHGVPLRVDEMSAVSCGGAPGLSDSFAAALWAVDALFQMARVGVDGVNIHTRPHTSGELFTFRRPHGSWQVTVHPQYYGLAMYAQAAPPGARLLHVSGSSGADLPIWGTRGPDRRVRVVLINKSLRSPRVVSVAVAGRAGRATLELLQAPSPSAKSQVTLGGQTYGSSSGVLEGHATSISVNPAGGRYVIRVPAASALMMTVG